MQFTIDPSARITTVFPHADVTVALEILVNTLEGVRYEQTGSTVNLYRK